MISGTILPSSCVGSKRRHASQPRTTKLSATDIFDFWSAVSSTDRIHPADRSVLARVTHGFDLSCLPTPWFGPLAVAPIVLLYLAPGLAPGFDRAFAETADGQKWARDIRDGHQPLPSKAQHEPAHRWWTSRVKAFHSPEAIADQVGIADIAPYHSVSFTDGPMLTALPSARAMVDWAQTELFPQAVRGERIVICMRSPRFWGLRAGWSEGALFSPETNRSGYLIHNDMRRQIVDAVRSKLGVTG